MRDTGHQKMFILVSEFISKFRTQLTIQHQVVNNYGHSKMYNIVHMSILRFYIM